MPVPKANAITNGVLLSTERLTTLAYKQGKSVVQVGAGNIWKSLYDLLANDSLAVTGGRFGAVGVSGLLLGGGFSYFSSEYGWGVDTARAMAATGALCFLGTRDLKKGEDALQDILEPDRVELIEIDVGSLASVRAAAKSFLSKSSTLNVLINNAAIMAFPKAKSVDGFESQLAINFLGHFLLYQLLEPTLLKSSTPAFNSRVVNVASSGHQASGVHFDNISLEGEYDPWTAYGQSKTATIYMTNEIERRYGSQGLHGLSLMPGGIATELQRYVPDELKKAWSTGEAVQKFWKSTAQGAATTMVAAIGKEWEGKGGVYLEDCQEAILTPPGGEGTIGFAAHAFDPEKETKLWDVATKMVQT